MFTFFEEQVQNTSNFSSLYKKKSTELNSVGQVWSYIDYVFILSPAANAF